MLIGILGLVAERQVAWAGCNLIPVAERTFPSTLGAVGSPITAPGKTVRIRVTPCDASPGFEPVAANNAVELTFQPPGAGADTIVAITLADGLAVSDCVLPGGRCGVLQFTHPDTNGLLPPAGLAGPARITVRDAQTTLVAEIGTLFQPTTSCDREPERTFEQFTALPQVNSYADAANNIATSLRATVDGSGSLLIPLDYWGNGTNSVLAETPGAPVAVFLKGEAEIPAMGAGDPNTIQQVLAAQETPSDFVRSFTLNGRPLPPLLRVTNDGDLFGTSDTIESVIRIARSDGMGGPNLFDLSDRLSAAGRGPIIISTFDVQVNQPVPLQGLRASSGTVAYTRDESREVMNLNSLSGDADTADHVCQVVDAVAGTATNTGKAVTQTPNGFFAASALLTSDGLTAFLESEAGQNALDLDGDGGSGGNIVRVFDDAGVDLTAGVHVNASLARQVDGRTLAISGSKVFFRTPGDFIGTQPTGVAGPVPPGGKHGIALSADGAFVYATSGDDWISVSSRDAMTGALTFVEAEFDGAGGVSGLSGAAGMAISPDGAHLYVAGATGDSIVVFARDGGTGALTFVEAQLNNANGVTDLDEPRQLAISPDGSHLYVAAHVGHAVVAFSRNPGTGALTYLESEVDGANGVDGILFTHDLVVSPDGTNVYVIGRGDNAVASFSRDTGTGALTFLEAQFDNEFSDTGFRDPRCITISADGGRVYATGSGVAGFDRNPTTGLLTQTGAIYAFQMEDLEWIEDVVVSRDGAYIYVVDQSGTTLVVLREHRATRALSFQRSSINGVGGVSGLVGAQVLALTPDDSQVYVHGGEQFALFRTSVLLGVFDATGLSLLSPQPTAESVAAGAERAVILTREAAAGVDLNGDSDALTGGDLVAQLYDASGLVPVVSNLAVAASQAAIGQTHVALAVSEAYENQLSPNGTDLNGDGDFSDDVLAVFEIGTVGPPQSIGVAAHSIAVTGTRVVFLTSEYDEGASGIGCAATVPPGGCDLNADGDNDDWVLRIYDDSADDLVTIALSVWRFVIEGTRVAFLASEYGQGIALNDDGNEDGDDVIHVYDLESGELINTRITGFPCDLPGCEPTIPFKLKGDTVSFLTSEFDEGCCSEGSGRDRNIDGDIDDIVLTVYSLASRQAQFVTTVRDDGNGVDPLAPAPLPTEDVGAGTIVYVTAKESSVGEDVNGDGVIDDSIVVLLTGDIDEDGTFDDLDTCMTAANPLQSDIDADNLGDDTCDPNLECPPEPLEDCRVPTVAGAGKSVLTIKNKDDDSKDSVKWTWVKGSATDVAALGDPVSGAAAYALCVYDDSSQNPILVSSRVAPGGTCEGEPCWQPKGDTGFKYSDTAATQNGIKKITLKSGDAGKAKMIVKGQGAGLGLRTLPATTPIVAQLHVRDGDRVDCWQNTFTTFKKNDAGVFKAKSD